MKLLQTLTLAMLIIAPAAFASTDNLLTVRQPVAQSNDPILRALQNVDLNKAKEWYAGVKEQAGNAISKAGNALESARNNPDLQARFAAATDKAVEAKQGVVSYLQDLLGQFDKSTTPAVNPTTGAPYTPAEQKGLWDRIKEAYEYVKQNAPQAQQPAAQQSTLGSLWNTLTGANTQPAPATAAPYATQQQGTDWNAVLQQAKQALGY